MVLCWLGTEVFTLGYAGSIPVHATTLIKDTRTKESVWKCNPRFGLSDAVLKTVGEKSRVGSRPTTSATSHYPNW